MQNLTTYLFPPMVFQFQKRQLQRLLIKPQYSKIQYFSCHVNKIIKYLKHFPSFGIPKVIPDNEIINLIKFSLNCEWHKQLFVQGL